MKMIFLIGDLLPYKYATTNMVVDDSSISIACRPTTMLLELKTAAPTKFVDMFRLSNYIGPCKYPDMVTFSSRFLSFIDEVWKVNIDGNPEILAACGYFCTTDRFLSYKKTYQTFCCGAVLENRRDPWSHKDNCPWVASIFGSGEEIARKIREQEQLNGQCFQAARFAMNMASKALLGVDMRTQTKLYCDSNEVCSLAVLRSIMTKNYRKDVNHFILEGLSGVGKSTMIEKWAGEYRGLRSDFRNIALQFPICGTGNSHESLSATLYSHMSAATSLFKPPGAITDRGGMIPLNGVLYSLGLRDKYMTREITFELIAEIVMILYNSAKLLSANELTSGFYCGRLLESTLIILDREVKQAVNRIIKRDQEGKEETAIKSFEKSLGMTVEHYIVIQNIMWAIFGYYLQEMKVLNINVIDVWGDPMGVALARKAYLYPTENLDSLIDFLHKTSLGCCTIKRGEWENLLIR